MPQKFRQKAILEGASRLLRVRLSSQILGASAEAIALRCCFQQIAVPVTTTPNRMEVQQVYIVTIPSHATPSMPPPCIKY
jgi:hypothetical protein